MQLCFQNVCPDSGSGSQTTTRAEVHVREMRWSGCSLLLTQKQCHENLVHVCTYIVVMMLDYPISYTEVFFLRKYHQSHHVL